MKRADFLKTTVLAPLAAFLPWQWPQQSGHWKQEFARDVYHSQSGAVHTSEELVGRLFDVSCELLGEPWVGKMRVISIDGESATLQSSDGHALTLNGPDALRALGL